MVPRFVPLEVAAPVIIWFGLITVGQAVTEVPSNQAIAVVMGLIPALSQWATGIADTVARKQAAVLMELAPRMGGDLAMGGLIALRAGIAPDLDAVVRGAGVHDPAPFRAGGRLVGSGRSTLGGGHHSRYKLSPNGVESLIGWWVAPQFTLAYAGGAVFLLACAWYSQKKGNSYGTS